VKPVAEITDAELMAALDEIEHEWRARRAAARIADDDEKDREEYERDMSLGGKPYRGR
jgi:hypothetical protein